VGPEGRRGTQTIQNSPLIGPDGPRGKRRLRILRGIVCESALFVGVTVLSPLLLAGAAVVDFVLWLRRRKPWMSVRIVFLAWWFLFGELRGLLGLLGVWVLAGGPWARDTPTRRQRTYRLQVSWAAGHIAGVCRACRVGFDVEGDELIGPGPVIVLSRHASIVDNGLPAMLISRPHDLDLRYVLKSELQALPTLDIGARWVPTYFVRRRSDGDRDRDRELDRLRTLAQGLDGERDGVLIFPEGTRFTQAKLAALRAEAEAKGPGHVDRVAGLRHLLPARPGGPIALLTDAPQAAVIVCGHVGLDDFHALREIWGGGLMDKRVRVRFWRHERDELPSDPDELVDWLTERWQALDDWVEEQLTEERRSGHLVDVLPAESAA
jgi:1-acyl-sn-glycerol-3-phosphate acyltransferase